MTLREFENDIKDKLESFSKDPEKVTKAQKEALIAEMELLSSLWYELE